MTEEQKKKLLQFLKFILPALETNKKQQGYLWINNPNTDFNIQKYFNSYSEAIELIEKYRHNNCYIGLASTDGKGYKTENLISRNAIFIDIDEDDLDIKNIYDLCKKNQIFGHMIVNSGRGWHIYLKLDKSYDIYDIVNVNKELVKLFDADVNAIKTTQIARIPYTKNFKVNKYASIVNTNNIEIKPYKLKALENHKIIEFKTGNTELKINDINDLYCFSELVKNGASKGFRNESLIFISSTCKYADLDEKTALHYALEFNENCIEPQRKNEVIKVVKSIYSNISIIKPCTSKTGQKLCNMQCKAKVITVDDVLKQLDPDIDKDKLVGFTRKIFQSKIKVSRLKNKIERIEKGTMLNVLTGSEILIISELKTFKNNIHTVESLVERTKLSKPTVTKALKTLEELNIVNTTKQSINKSTKPTNIYSFNEESTQKYKEVVFIGRGLFICRINKLITDSDMKVYLALKYLIENRLPTTQEDIEMVSGITRNHINTSLDNLNKRDIIRIDKMKTNTGHYNVYTLKL